MTWWSSIYLQNSSSPFMEQLTFFHDHTMMIMTLIMSTVSYLMIKPLFNSFIHRSLLEHHTLETVWTTIPAVMLIMIALPSLRLLYLMDETDKPSITIKSMGHQWFWSYEYSDFQDIEFYSYMINTEDLKKNMFRMIEVDNNMLIPMFHQIRLITSSTDVIHSWTIPSLGVKADAIPGRLNQMNFSTNRPGLLFGQCSEICGTNHSFMPIVVETVNLKKFISWLKSF